MQGTQHRNLSYCPRAARFSLSRSEPKAMRVGLTISLVAHSATLVAVVLCLPSHRSSSPQVIPVSIAIIGEAENRGFQVSTRPELGFGHGSVIPKSKPTPPSSQAKAEQTVLVVKLAEPPPQGNQSSRSQTPGPLVKHKGGMPTAQAALAEPQHAGSQAASVQPRPAPETYLWNTTQTSAADGSSDKGFVEEQHGQRPGVKITRHTDWEANP